MIFITAYGEVQVSNGLIRHNIKTNYVWHKNLLFLVVFAYATKMLIRNVQSYIAEDIFNLDSVIYAFVVLFYAIRVFEILIFQILKIKIKIQSISKIKVIELENKLELSVLIINKKNRYKKIFFRKLENQHNNFIEELLKINPNIEIENNI